LSVLSLSWTYLKLPLSAKVHSQSCCLNCIHRGVTRSPSWPECVTLCLDNTLLVPIFFSNFFMKGKGPQATRPHRFSPLSS
jgi:hypothetical protein